MSYGFFETAERERKCGKCIAAISIIRINLKESFKNSSGLAMVPFQVEPMRVFGNQVNIFFSPVRRQGAIHALSPSRLRAVTASAACCAWTSRNIMEDTLSELWLLFCMGLKVVCRVSNWCQRILSVAGSRLSSDKGLGGGPMDEGLNGTRSIFSTRFQSAAPCHCGERMCL